MKMARIAPICLALVAVCALSACRKPTTGAAITIGIVPMGTTDPYWEAVHAAASQEGARLGVVVLWPTAFHVGDIGKQIAAVKDMQRRGAQAIALAPIDPTFLSPTVDGLVTAGVPTVIFDSSMGRDDIPFIGSDNRAAGREAGQYMVEALGGRGGVVVLRPDAGASSTDDRVSGFREVIEQQPGMSVFERTVGAGLEPAFVQSQEIMKTVKTHLSGQIAGVFTPNQSTTVGMVRALENFKLIRQIVHVGFDTSPLLANLLRRGEVDALVVQDPNAMGRLSVVTLLRMIRKEPAERRTSTRTVIATPETANLPDITALLKPDLTIIHQ